MVFIAFAAIVIFGFAAMGTHDMNGHSDCIATMGQAVLCSHNSAIAMAQQHAQFFQKMTSAVSLSLFMAFILCAVSAWLDRKRLLAVYEQLILTIKRKLLEIYYLLHRRPLLSWLTVSGKTASTAV